MAAKLIFWPVLLQIVLSIAVYLMLQIAKTRATRKGEVDESRRALFEDAWPDYVRQINNNIRNQFEVPVLFYALVMMVYALDAAGIAAQAAAWLFALSRVVHVYIHTGSNYVPRRRAVFTFGVIMLLVLAGLATVALVKVTLM